MLRFARRLRGFDGAGHRLGLQLTSDTTGYFFMRFPSAELARIEARFAALAR